MDKESGHANFSALISALNHKLRTPLSVVSNELEIIRPRIAAEDYELTRRRLLEVVSTLTEVSELAQPLGELRICPLGETLRRAAQQAALTVHVNDREAMVRGNRELLERALIKLLTLCSAALEGATPIVKAGLESAEHVVRLSLIFDAALDSAPASYQSLTAYFNVNRGLDSVIPPCLDSIMSAHHARVLIQAVPASQQLLLWLEFPAA